MLKAYTTVPKNVLAFQWFPEMEIPTELKEYVKPVANFVNPTGINGIDFSGNGMQKIETHAEVKNGGTVLILKAGDWVTLDDDQQFEVFPRTKFAHRHIELGAVDPTA